MSNIVVIDEEKKSLIRNTIARQLSEQQFELFINIAKSRGLDPVLGQIHSSVHKDKNTGKLVMTPIVGIDGFRLIAHRTSEYAGREEVRFEYEENSEIPSRATVTVYRLVQGHRCAFTASARWKEYLPGQEKKRFMWLKMPETMLEKCAEAKALRMAFPNDLSGLYVDEEMHQQEMRDVNSFEPQEKNHDKLVQAFMALQIGPKDICNRYDIEDVSKLTDEHVADLREIYVKVSKGEAASADYFSKEELVGA